MRARTFHFPERISFGATGYPWRVTQSSLRPGGGATSLSSRGGTRFHAFGRSGDSGPGAGSLPVCPRTWSNRTGVESPVSRRIGSGEARANGNGAWHAADVGGFCRREAGGAHFWKTQ